jgi:hypothetical protein
MGIWNHVSPQKVEPVVVLSPLQWCSRSRYFQSHLHRIRMLVQLSVVQWLFRNRRMQLLERRQSTLVFPVGGLKNDSLEVQPGETNFGEENHHQVRNAFSSSTEGDRAGQSSPLHPIYHLSRSGVSPVDEAVSRLLATYRENTSRQMQQHSLRHNNSICCKRTTEDGESAPSCRSSICDDSWLEYYSCQA